jgi:hypothetical protein
VNFVSLKDGIDLGTPAGRLIANVLASVAAYETEVRAERIAAGKAAKAARGEDGADRQGVEPVEGDGARRAAAGVRRKASRQSANSTCSAIRPVARVRAASRSTFTSGRTDGGRRFRRRPDPHRGSGSARATYGIDFKLWLLLVESGRFDRDGFNALFRDQLTRLLPRVNDERRRASLERVRGTDFVGYILTSLRNAGLGDDRDREEAAHDVIVQLLVSPGQLFSGYDPDRSGPMEARFALSVRNAVLNVLRSRRRREPLSRAVGGTGVEAVPDRRQDADDEILAAFLAFLKNEVGDDAVKLLTAKMDNDLSQRNVIRHPAFAGLGEWRIRRLMMQIKDAATAFARRRGDDGFLAAITKLMARKDEGASLWLAA